MIECSRPARQPRGNLRRACRTMEEMAPAVMWFEISRWASSASASALPAVSPYLRLLPHLDAGEDARLFVAATATGSTCARRDDPPGALRRSVLRRPSKRGRASRRSARSTRAARGIPHEPLGLNRLKQFHRGWTGAELEQLVVSALTTAKLEDRALTATTCSIRPARSSRCRDDEGTGRTSAHGLSIAPCEPHRGSPELIAAAAGPAQQSARAPRAARARRPEAGATTLHASRFTPRYERSVIGSRVAARATCRSMTRRRAPGRGRGCWGRHTA